MKIDVDSILYILITIAILVISGLGSRRKRKAVSMKPPQSAGPDLDSSAERDTRQVSYEAEKDPRKGDRLEGDRPAPTWQPSGNVVERLDQFFGSRETLLQSQEGESLETIPDEEEQILAEIRERREKPESEPNREGSETGQFREDSEPETSRDEHESMEEEKYLEVQSLKRRKSFLTDFFRGPNEIKKAIIYSEILKRKY